MSVMDMVAVREADFSKDYTGEIDFAEVRA